MVIIIVTVSNGKEQVTCRKRREGPEVLSNRVEKKSRGRGRSGFRALVLHAIQSAQNYHILEGISTTAYRCRASLALEKNMRK